MGDLRHHVPPCVEYPAHRVCPCSYDLCHSRKMSLVSASLGMSLLCVSGLIADARCLTNFDRTCVLAMALAPLSLLCCLGFLSDLPNVHTGNMEFPGLW